MKKFFLCMSALVLVGASCATPHVQRAVPSQADGAWEPARMWVFAVGVLEWQNSESFVSFPKEGRRDEELMRLLVERGVPQDHLIFLMDADATKERIERGFTDMVKKIPEGDTLMVYYAGHGAKDATGEAYFAPYDAGDFLSRTAWSMSWIHRSIEKYFRGKQVIFTGDACYSGSLGEGSGFHTKKPYTSFASSLSSQPSTSNWTFTESLIAGLRGDTVVDADHNGKITFVELSRYISAEMAFVDGQRSSFVTHRFNRNAVIAQSVAPAAGQGIERVEVNWKEGWYKAKIIGRRAGESKIHYVGYADSYDEWVMPNRMRLFAPPQFSVSTSVDVAWSPSIVFDKKRAAWYPAHVLKAEDGLHFVHYDGYSDVWDEWVSPSRIRPN